MSRLQNKFMEKSGNAFTAMKAFLKLESAAGIIMAAMAVIAMIIANSPLYGFYDHVLHYAGVDVLQKSLLHWINDGLMAIFFFLVGLEIKREFVSGELSSRDRAILPAIAAVGGMAVPALIFFLFNMNYPENLPGWAIPSATDIAFTLGILSLLGNRVPLSIKVLLTAIAVIDDMGAIAIIALFYADSIQTEPLALAGAVMAGLLLLNRRGIQHPLPYIVLAFALWFFVLQSGVHATLAGVIAAFFIPATPGKKMEHGLHPWVAFGILPLFAFANAGVSFTGVSLDHMINPVVGGIATGLFIGKPIGIFGAIWLAVKAGICRRPHGATWGALFAMAVLCGIGFTMSLFIGMLAYDGHEMQVYVRLGVLGGSLAAAVAGYIIMKAVTRPLRTP